MPRNPENNVNRLWGLAALLAVVVLILIVVLVVVPWAAQTASPATGPGGQTPAPSIAAAPAGPIHLNHGLQYAGMPRSVAPGTEVKVLENAGYIVGYSESRRDPLWVCYRLFKVDHPPHLPRPRGFHADPRTAAHIEPADYNGSGYDRGHLAPNEAIAECYGEEAQHESFLMSNIVPQLPSYNRGIWKELEGQVMGDFAQRFDQVWVTTGPIFEEPAKEIKGGVAVPARCYKIVLREDHGHVDVIAWDIPQTATGRDLTPYLTSVKTIEQGTGLAFFPELPPAERAAMATERLHAGW